MKRRTFLAIAGIAALFPGCQTANYNQARLGVMPGRNARDLENLTQQQVSEAITPQARGPVMPYEESETLAALYSGLPRQRIKVFYPNQENNGLTEERILDTTNPINIGGNDRTLSIIQSMMAQVPCNAQIRTYDLGQAAQDTLSPRTPSNQLSGEDGLKVVKSLSGYECNQFTVEAMETSKVDRRFAKRDDYFFIIHFNKKSFQAQKKRKDFRWGLETALNVGTASTTLFFLSPWGYITPAVVLGEDLLNAGVAKLEARNAPSSSALYSQTHFGTLLPREASLIVNVLDNSAEHKGKEVIFTNLTDDCGRPCGEGVAITQGAYDVRTGPNCIEFCLDQNRGRFEIDLLRRLSNIAPVIVETTKTRTQVYNSGGGRNGSGGGNCYGPQSGGDRGSGGGGNSYGGGRGAGAQ